jgi:hypothetical protein
MGIAEEQHHDKTPMMTNPTAFSIRNTGSPHMGGHNKTVLNVASP